MRELLSVPQMRRTEQVGLANTGKQASVVWATVRVIALFIVVLAGIVASFVYPEASAVIQNKAEWDFGGVGGVAARLVVSLILAFVTFVPIYNKINDDAKKNNSSESFVVWFLAFQNGFFWQAIYDGAAPDTAGLTTPEPSDTGSTMSGVSMIQETIASLL